MSRAAPVSEFEAERGRTMFCGRALPFVLYLMLYLTGTTRLTLDPISGGNGRPLALRAISSAAWSSIDDPELPINRADMTWPLRPIVRASRTVPRSPRPRAASG
jgi:hypothetical protein